MTFQHLLFVFFYFVGSRDFMQQNRRKCCFYHPAFFQNIVLVRLQKKLKIHTILDNSNSIYILQRQAQDFWECELIWCLCQFRSSRTLGNLSWFSAGLSPLGCLGKCLHPGPGEDNLKEFSNEVRI